MALELAPGGGRSRGGFGAGAVEVVVPEHVVEDDPGVAGSPGGGHALSLVVGRLELSAMLVQEGVELVAGRRPRAEAAQAGLRRRFRTEDEGPVGSFLADDVVAVAIAGDRDVRHVVLLHGS
jgi:hypothetical protein